MRFGLAVTFALLLAATGCGTQTGDGTTVPASEPPAVEPTVVGIITQVAPFEPVTEGCVEPDARAEPDAPVSSDDPPICTDPDSSVLGTVLVEEDPTAASGDVKVSFAIKNGTALLAQRGETYEEISFGDLVEGKTVSAWADGAIMESYPAQATAAAIVLSEGQRP